MALLRRFCARGYTGYRNRPVIEREVKHACAEDAIRRGRGGTGATVACAMRPSAASRASTRTVPGNRSEEHTSELQSRENLVCRLLLEKKKEQECTIP